MEAWLGEQARRRGFPATSFRPGHIVGEGWLPINPLGKLNPEVFSKIARGEELVLPNLGLEICLLYTSPSPRDAHESRMPSSA